MTGPLVIGVDPSLTCTGIASSDGWIETVGAKQVTTLPIAARVDAVDRLAETIVGWIWPADLVVIEEPLPAGRNPADTSGLERHALVWLVVRWLVRNERPFVLVNNRHRGAYATGNAAGRKADVVAAVAEFWPTWKAGKNDNKADAVVLMALGRHALGHPLGEVPKINARTVEQIEWPIEAAKAAQARRDRARRRPTKGARQSLPAVCMIPDCGCSGDAHP
jgi:Holliday junction resolvasome RuvABC endonuclease subunit